MNALSTSLWDNKMPVIFVFIVGLVLLPYVTNLWIHILSGIFFYKILLLLRSSLL